MKECFHCGLNPQEWKEITKECTIELLPCKIPVGSYMVLIHKGIQLGSITEKGFTEYQEKFVNEFKVKFKPRDIDDGWTYFKVFNKKSKKGDV